MKTILYGDTRRKRAVSGSEESLAVALFHLTHLLQAGVGLSDSLATVRDLESRYRMRQVWVDIRASVNAGYSLSASISQWPAVFPQVLIALLKAGEANAQLDQACQQSMEMLHWQSGLKSRLTTALVYPAFAMLVLFAVVGFLFVAVVPSMKEFLLSTQSSIVWHTRWLIIVSAWLSAYLLPVVLSVLSIVVVAIVAERFSMSWRLLSDSMRLRLPVLGQIWTSVSLSRYASTSARLYASGVQLEQSLKLSEELVSNTALRLQLSEARQSMIAGAGLSRSMADATRVPQNFRTLLAAGEASGALEKALHRAGAQQQQLADLAISRTEALLGPVLLLLIGVSLLWIVVSVLGPVYNSAIDAVVFS